MFLNLLVIFFAIGCCASSPDKPRNLLIISLDGFRWDYLYYYNDKLLNFRKFLYNGTHSLWLEGVFRSELIPSHTTIITGLLPEHHGLTDSAFKYWARKIQGENFYDGLAKILKHEFWQNASQYIEPIWTRNELLGGLSGVYGWPFSGNLFMNTTPHIHDEAYAQDIPSFKEKLDAAIKAFVSTDPKEKINLALIYFVEPDTTGHKYGPISNETMSILTQIDEQLGYLMKKVEDNGLLDVLNIIIVSDHGMIDLSVSEGIYLWDFIDKQEIFKHIRKGGIRGGQTSLIFYPKSESDYKDLYKKLTNINTQLGKLAIKVYKPEHLPNRMRFPHEADDKPIVVVSQPPYVLLQKNEVITDDCKRQHSPINGDHGYDPAVPEMRGIFLAKGPAFKQRFISNSIHMIDLYEIFCRALCIPSRKNDGAVWRIKRLFVKNYCENIRKKQHHKKVKLLQMKRLKHSARGFNNVILQNNYSQYNYNVSKETSPHVTSTSITCKSENCSDDHSSRQSAMTTNSKIVLTVSSEEYRVHSNHTMPSPFAQVVRFVNRLFNIRKLAGDKNDAVNETNYGSSLADELEVLNITSLDAVNITSLTTESYRNLSTNAESTIIPNLSAIENFSLKTGLQGNEPLSTLFDTTATSNPEKFSLYSSLTEFQSDAHEQHFTNITAALATKDDSFIIKVIKNDKSTNDKTDNNSASNDTDDNSEIVALNDTLAALTVVTELNEAILNSNQTLVKTDVHITNDGNHFADVTEGLKNIKEASENMTPTDHEYRLSINNNVSDNSSYVYTIAYRPSLITKVNKSIVPPKISELNRDVENSFVSTEYIRESTFEPSDIQNQSVYHKDIKRLDNKNNSTYAWTMILTDNVTNKSQINQSSLGLHDVTEYELFDFNVDLRDDKEHPPADEITTADGNQRYSRITSDYSSQGDHRNSNEIHENQTRTSNSTYVVKTSSVTDSKDASDRNIQTAYKIDQRERNLQQEAKSSGSPVTEDNISSFVDGVSTSLRTDKSHDKKKHKHPTHFGRRLEKFTCTNDNFFDRLFCHYRRNQYLRNVAHQKLTNKDIGNLFENENSYGFTRKNRFDLIHKSNGLEIYLLKNAEEIR